jgi:hypothetical protein
VEGLTPLQTGPATRGRELFALGRPATSEQTIATIWTVSVRQLRQLTPAAEDLLVLLAFLSADDIPRALPAQHLDQLPKRLAAAVRNPLAYQQTLGALGRYSLLKTSPDGQTLGCIGWSKRSPATSSTPSSDATGPASRSAWSAAPSLAASATRPPGRSTPSCCPTRWR